jgi:antitoxin MazE
MRKNLTSIGNSLGLVIEKPILDLLNITKDTELDLSTDGKRLIVEPVRGSKRKRIADAARRAMDAHESTFRRLAE